MRLFVTLIALLSFTTALLGQSKNNLQTVGKAAQKMLKADYINTFSGASDAYLIRKKTNQKWGVYTYRNNKFTEYLPCIYDQIIYDSDKKYVVLEQNMKLGIYHIDDIKNPSIKNYFAGYDQIDTTYINQFFLIYKKVRGKTGLSYITPQYDSIIEAAPAIYTEFPKFNTLEDIKIIRANGKSGAVYFSRDSIQVLPPDYNQIIIDSVGVKVQNKNLKWSLLNLGENEFYFDFVYENHEDLPHNFTDFSLGVIWFAHRHLDADLVDINRNIGDGVFHARNKRSKKWGRFQYLYDTVNYETFVPMKYDSIVNVQYNNRYYMVANNGKYGIYMKPNETVPCIYAKLITVNYTVTNAPEESKVYMAGKKDEFWGWVDWSSGKELSEFKYKTYDDLPDPYYLDPPEFYKKDK